MTCPALVQSRQPARHAGIATVLLLLLPLLLAPLPLASVAETPRAWLTAALAAAAAVVFARALRLGRPLAIPPGAVALLLFAAVGFVQLLPIAAGGERAAKALGGPIPATLSVLPLRTLPRACEVLALVAAFVAAAVLLRRTSRAMAVCSALLALGAALSVYGLLMQRGVLPAVDPEQTREVLVATYFNRNHFAGLLEMAVLAGLGALGACSRGASPRILLGGGIAACLLGLVLTESRGGLVAVVAGAAVCLLLAPVRHRKWSFALLALATVLALWLVPDSLMARLHRAGNEVTAAGSRLDIWRGALALWLVFPWFGGGLGTFGDLSPATQLPHTGGRIEHAHNDPLELLAETGAAGGLLLAAAAAAFFCHAARQRRCGGNDEAAWLAAGATGAVAAIAVHGLVDFNLQIPANAAWLAVLAGMAAGLRGSGRPLRRPAAAAAVLLLAAVTAASAQRGLSTGAPPIAGGQQLLQESPAEAAAVARAALAQNPLSPSAHLLLGEALQRQRDPGAEAAFAQALRWSDAGIRPRRQFEIGIACLGAGDLEAARRWLHELFERHPERWTRLLADLYASASAWELMAPLVPPGPPELRLLLAGELLRQGDFAGRERELAALRGDAAPALLTLGDGVLLQRCERDDRAERDLALTLAFAIAQGAVPARAVLRCRGSGAALSRSFVPAATPFRWELRLDPTFPPGDYALELDFGKPQRLRLGSLQLPDSPLDVGVDALQRAASTLFWSTAEPERRGRRDGGLLLRHGDRLWREVSLPADACTLVLRCASPGALHVAFAGTTLAQASAAGSPVQRYALPPLRRGELAIENAGDREVAVIDFFVTGGRQDR